MKKMRFTPFQAGCRAVQEVWQWQYNALVAVQVSEDRISWTAHGKNKIISAKKAIIIICSYT
jgi:hypothetical protein